MDDLSYLHSVFDDDQNTTVKKSERPLIVLVEDDEVLGPTLKKYLYKRSGLDVYYFSGPQKCLEELPKILEKEGLLKEAPFCLITDLSFNESSIDGLRLIDQLREAQYNFVSMAMTGFASIETAIQATKKGVFHYLTKPFELDDFYGLVVKACVDIGYSDEIFSSPLLRENNLPNLALQSYRFEIPSKDDFFFGMLGRSKVMKSVFERISKVSHSSSTVIVNGPSGTGKELVANAIHGLSPRSANKLVSINCGAIPADLLESELFGHEKGAFTGAITSRKGRFEEANGGTIFLDEIGDMPLILQVKLLRVIQERVIERVGGGASIPIDVRIIAATHKDLEKAVEKGAFREDLFYRLSVIPIKIPSLQERREDIPLLISYFLNKFVSADGRNKIEISKEALDVFMSYSWPGNVRELENLVERLVILKGGGVVGIEDLPTRLLKHRPEELILRQDLLSLPEDGLDLKKIMASIEESFINQALMKTEGNKNKASKLLGINRTTLIEKIKKREGLSIYL